MRITDNLLAAHPAWTPDGEHIIFATHEKSTANLFKMSVSEKTPKQLTFFSGEVSVFNPAVSPDGSQVVFSFSGEDGNTDLYLLEFSSGESSRLTTSPAVDYLPVWSPDGAALIINDSKIHLNILSHLRGPLYSSLYKIEHR